jgi:haloalkane dehalogenase
MEAISMSISAAAAADLFRREPDRFLDVGAGEVAYRTVGSGPDVLFVHGWPVSSATFRTLLPHLAEHVTCHLVDLPGAGSSRFTADTPLSIQNHINSVRRALDLLELDDVAVVGHDSGGMIARHAVAGDPRLRALGLIDTEQSTGLSWKFKSFIAGRRIPGFGAGLGWLAGQPRLRRSRLVLGDAFVDRSLLDGEFDEFFLRPLHESREYRDATMRLLRSFDYQHVRDLGALHKRIEVPVQLVWGEQDRFFPVKWARDMVATFPNARLQVIAGAGLFAHEERPAEVAAALLPTLTAKN